MTKLIEQPFVSEVRTAQEFARKQERKINSIISEATGADLTLNDWELLEFIAQGTATAAEIANARGVDRAAVSRQLERLRKKRVLVTHQNPVDRRSIEVFITKNGLKALLQINSAMDEALCQECA